MALVEIKIEAKRYRTTTGHFDGNEGVIEVGKAVLGKKLEETL